MKELVKEEELLIKVEYGCAYITRILVEKNPQPHEHLIESAKKETKWKRVLGIIHRSGKRNDFEVPEPFKKMLMSKIALKKDHPIIDFALATYHSEKLGQIIYTIAITHKVDNFRRKIAREIVTGRIRRYLKDKYKTYKGYDFEDELGNTLFWLDRRPKFIHVEVET